MILALMSFSHDSAIRMISDYLVSKGSLCSPYRQDDPIVLIIVIQRRAFYSAQIWSINTRVASLP